MCVVFLAFQTDPAHPVMVGANREESRRRPTTSPVCCCSEGFRCLLAGADFGPDGSFPGVGTWLGVNEAGLLVAVTNRRDGELAWEDQTRSRGVLAVSLLGFDDPGEASRFARGELAGGGFGGSNYLIVNRRDAFAVEAPAARRVSVERLRPGVRVMTNLGPGDPRIRYVRYRLDPGRFVPSAREVCRDGRVVAGGGERGTVSSSLILVGDGIRFFHRIGDPRDGDYLEFQPFVH
jgi:uncharacterized protein with NRDE domain